MAHPDMQTILVTGGAGFIGSHLATRLVKNGHRVRILDTLSPQIHGMLPSQSLNWLTSTDGVEFCRGSITVEAELLTALKDVTAVVHLASETGTGQSMYQIDRYCRENVQGTALLMQLLTNGAAPSVRRILLASSRSVYGEGAYVPVTSPQDIRITPHPRTAETLRDRRWEPTFPGTGEALKAVPTREDDRTAPASIYAATKLMQEDLVRISCDGKGIGYAILRLQNVYGEGQSLSNPYTGILSIFSTRIRRGLELPIFEDGLESRDFVHVSDVVAAFVAAIESPAPVNDVVNVGSGVATSIVEVARALSRAFATDARIRITGEFRLGDIRHNLADISRLRDKLGVAPKVSLEDGLSRFATWVQEQSLPEDQLAQANAELVRRKMMG
jgi:dTDP-L-rhamnose 4-epimerase